MIQGLNHMTLAVRDLQESLDFYADVLSCEVVAQWPRGAYLLAGELWLALIVDSEARSAALPEYTHLAFSVEESDFAELSTRIINAGAQLWQDNRSEGASLYFLDPNGHKLEIHVGNLHGRLRSLQAQPMPGLEIKMELKSL